MDKFLALLKGLIDSVNLVSSQVWAITILLIGAVLVGIHQGEHGSMVIGGGLALLQHRSLDQQAAYTAAAAPAVASADAK
jgi:hypothetical protein